jgi:pyruvate/2-oxoglutarate/acetoin dehydrogenase E1 component
MYREPLHLVLRCPSGGYRGYGATHSQSIEKIYLGLPGIQVIAASIASDPGKLLNKALDSGVPTLFVENKLDYPKELLLHNGNFWTNTEICDSEEMFPINRIRVSGDDKPDYTIITYGGMAYMAMDAMKILLYEDEINVDILVVSDLNYMLGVCRLVESKMALVLEEGAVLHGWGAEIGCCLLEEGIKVRRCGALDSFIPASKSWEENILPNKNKIISIIREDLM